MQEHDVARRDEGPRPAVTLAFALAYLAAGLIGRQAVLDDTVFALVWPAAGVAVVWLLVRRAEPFSPDTVVLALVSFAANFVTGAPVQIALVLMFSNTIQAVVAVVLIRRWCPSLWGAGGDRPLDSPRVTARYLGAASVGMATGMVIGVTGTRLTGGEAGVLQAVLWFDRNLCGVLAVTTLALLVGRRLESPHPRPPLVERYVELLAAGAFSVVLYTVTFAFDGKPLAFTLLAATVWVGLRFSTLISAGHSLVAGTAAIVLTLDGHGPFAVDSGSELGALLVQSFVAMIFVTGVLLSTGREERHALASELRESMDRAEYQARVLDTVVSGIVEGLVVVDSTGEVLLANPAASVVLGVEEPLRGNVIDFGGRHVDGSPIPEDQMPSRRALRGETLRDVDVLYTAPDGTERVLSMSAAPLDGVGPDRRSGAAILLRDATTDFNQRAELAAFAGVVAHDLRNPLAAIDGWTELLEDEAGSGELQPHTVVEFIGRVRASSQRMHGLILHLLAHATSKDVALSVTRLDLSESVRRIAAARGATEHVVVGEIPAVLGDRVLVDQLLENLIGNALKYVAPEVVPRIEVHGRSDSEGWVTVSVADNGIGLPTGEHEAVFEEFHRAHPAGYEGTGLGLSICRRIIARHGGTITARDNPGGQGTVFEFTLPEHA